jgi:hypothetical protein
MNNQPPPPDYSQGAPNPSSAPVPASFDPLGAGISTAPMPSNASWQPAVEEDAPKKSSLPMILALIAVIFGCILVVGVVTVLTVGGLR